jgi:hypothetical protein
MDFKISEILPGGANEQQVLEGIANGDIDINRVSTRCSKTSSSGTATICP